MHVGAGFNATRWRTLFDKIRPRTFTLREVGPLLYLTDRARAGAVVAAFAAFFTQAQFVNGDWSNGLNPEIITQTLSVPSESLFADSSPGAGLNLANA